MFLRKLQFGLLFCILSIGLNAQESDLGNWLIYIGSKKINPKLNWHHEVQYRNYNFVGDLEQLLLRTGIGYNLSENNNNLLVGYGFIRSENYATGSGDKQVVNEHRIFQQFTTSQNFHGISLSHRYRFEQRFVEDNFITRFRYFLSLKVPLTNKTIIPKTIYLSAYNEIFIHSDGPIFDRNRVYAALGYKLNPAVSIELGYMNQIFTNSSRDQLNILIGANF